MFTSDFHKQQKSKLYSSIQVTKSFHLPIAISVTHSLGYTVHLQAWLQHRNGHNCTASSCKHSLQSLRAWSCLLYGRLAAAVELALPLEVWPTQAVPQRLSGL